ncbi:MAG: flagellar basal body protein [Bryobacteraceae bacterium]|nr:flagellar biosynthesis protein FlgB [Solibacteraceae bacterium]MCL4842678.1 flagellar biosynthesis protein FlgB [Bryobacteraceae bacterium]MCO5354061.1 flagellar basal body protein [Bryobacteraceae bacterium]HAX44957.1 flagellar biosynthesis protein FlgB [Bryobacterales bacterium]HRJ21140.1 flagellar basal body protein [Bryobacteraceae bacterium]
MLDPIASRLESYLDLLAQRQKLVTTNIANADTPGYRTRDIDFQTEFQSFSRGASPTILNPHGLTVKNDGNDVSLDRESRLLAENAMRFNLAASLLKGQMQMVRKAIEEGKNG